MYISTKRFLLITFLFFFLPFSVNYRLLMFGTKTKGVVVDYQSKWTRGADIPEHKISNCIIRFYYSESDFVEFFGPEYVKYPIGAEMKIFYKEKDPEKFVMFNAAGLILNNRMIAPGVALIIWMAFYVAMRETQAKPRKKVKIGNRFKALQQKED